MEHSRREKIADLPFYTEGPVIDNNGYLYCTTLNGGSILKINHRNEISEWGRSLCPNGQIILSEGDHLVCDSKLAAVRRFSPEGRFLKNEIENFCSDIAIYSPNDLIVDHVGNLYFTDSIRYSGKVCFLGVNGEQHILASDLDYPNGLVLSADEKCLYIAESYKNRILKIELRQPGLAKGSFQIFSELPPHSSGNETDNLPDGIALNSAGELLVAHYGMGGIQKISLEGNVLLSIYTDMPFTSNLCFFDTNSIIVTGGYGEPGPGGVLKIYL